MRTDPDWQADLARCAMPRPLLKEPSLWAIRVYRWGRRLDMSQNKALASLYRPVYWFLFRCTELLTGISLPKSADIGGGLRIWHFGGVFVHGQARIGRSCTLRQGVTIGSRFDNGPAPVIGHSVDIGAYAQILGGITVGDRASIGAMAVVLCDVPAGATAVGNPARIVFKHSQRMGVVRG